MKKLNIILFCLILIVALNHKVSEVKNFLKRFGNFILLHEETFSNAVVIVMLALWGKIENFINLTFDLYKVNSLYEINNFSEIIFKFGKISSLLGIGVFCLLIFLITLNSKAYGKNNNWKDFFILAGFKFFITAMITSFSVILFSLNKVVVSIVILWVYDLFKEFAKGETSELWNKANEKKTE